MTAERMYNVRHNRYTAALASGDDAKLAKLVAKSSVEGNKAEGYDPYRYVGTYVTTHASQVGTTRRLTSPIRLSLPLLCYGNRISLSWRTDGLDVRVRLKIFSNL